MTVTIAFEDSKYLHAIYGGRAITQALAAKVAEVKAGLAEIDDFVTVGAGMTYSLTTGFLVVTRDDREVTSYVIECPPNGYWSRPGFDARKVGQYEVLMLRTTSTSPRSAESMFDWPIYRAAMLAPVRTAWKAAAIAYAPSDEYVHIVCMSCGKAHVGSVPFDACPSCGATDDELLVAE